MKILPVKRTNLWDIFIGYGWLNWTRVALRGYHIQYISGRYLPKIRIIEATKNILEIKHPTKEKLQ